MDVLIIQDHFYPSNPISFSYYQLVIISSFSNTQIPETERNFIYAFTSDIPNFFVISAPSIYPFFLSLVYTFYRHTIHILGDDFSDYNLLQCRFGSSNVSRIWISRYQIDCIVPYQPNRNISLEVTNNGFNFSESKFRLDVYDHFSVSLVILG